MIKKLSEFKDEEAIVTVSKLIAPVMKIVVNSKNKELQAKGPFEMFSGFFANSPKYMKEIFAILSGVDPDQYHCDGIEVAKNIMVLVSDDRLLELFTSQEQTEAVTSSGSASVIAKEA